MEENEVNLTAKDSNTSIASGINNLEIASQNSEKINENSSSEAENPSNFDDKEITTSQVDESLDTENNEIEENVGQTSSQNDKTEESSQISETSKECVQIEHDSSPSSDSQVTTSSSGSSEIEQPQKRKRKRKRRRKRKAINAYVPDEPFTKRYKKVMDISMKPKLHVKFDDSGNIVSYQNNYKPRIVAALLQNLPINDCPKENKLEQVEDEIQVDKCDELVEIPKVSLKPRIIKAIGT